MLSFNGFWWTKGKEFDNVKVKKKKHNQKNGIGIPCFFFRKNSNGLFAEHESHKLM